jgi:hypothetical protein
MTTPAYAAFVGIDWADEAHEVCLTSGGGRYEPRTVRQRAEDLDAWASDLRQRFGGRPVAVCLEQSRGALIYALLKYEFLRLYPLNPKQLARYREAFAPSGAKDDLTDARLLCQFVAQHHEQLRAWQPDDQSTRALRLLTPSSPAMRNCAARRRARSSSSCRGGAPRPTRRSIRASLRFAQRSRW